MREKQPPLEFFLTSSSAALESYELSRLGRASNMRKELRDLIEDWIEAEVNARVARLLLEARRNGPCAKPPLSGRILVAAQPRTSDAVLPFLEATTGQAEALVDLANLGSLLSRTKNRLQARIEHPIEPDQKIQLGQRSRSCPRTDDRKAVFALAHPGRAPTGVNQHDVPPRNKMAFFATARARQPADSAPLRDVANSVAGQSDAARWPRPKLLRAAMRAQFAPERKCRRG